jgi:ubiquinone/menaquinone biosynthesis C-methylase UbiE
MDKCKFEFRDFDNPSVWFVLEDGLKNLIGGPLMYGRYYRTFELKGDEKVMDFGCGGGVGSRTLSKMLDKGGSVTCVDLSGYWTRKAEKRLRKYSNATCIQGDIRDMDLPVSTYDIITVYHVLHDIVPLIRQEVIDTLSGLLKPDGRFFIVEPVKESHGMPAGEIRSLLANAGLCENGSLETKSAYSAEYLKTAD